MASNESVPQEFDYIPSYRVKSAPTPCASSNNLDVESADDNKCFGSQLWTRREHDVHIDHDAQE